MKHCGVNPNRGITVKLSKASFSWDESVVQRKSGVACIKSSILRDYNMIYNAFYSEEVRV